MSNYKGLEEKFKNLQSRKAKVEGHWTQIRWTPDIVTGEQIAIGVMVEINGFRHTKFIDDFDRLICGYGSNIAPHLDTVIDLIEYILNKKCKNSISPQILFDNRGFVRGDSASSILTELFDRVVPLGRPHSGNEATERFPTYRTASLITNLKSSIYNKIGDRVFEILPQESLLPVSDQTGIHLLEIPIRPVGSNQLGGITSTIYRTYDKFENNCLTAMNHLEAAKKCGLGTDAVLYTLMPNEHLFKLLSEPEQEKRFNFLKDFAWQLEMNEIEHRPFYDTEEMSDGIMGWAKLPTNNHTLFN